MKITKAVAVVSTIMWSGVGLALINELEPKHPQKSKKFKWGVAATCGPVMWVMGAYVVIHDNFFPRDPLEEFWEKLVDKYEEAMQAIKSDIIDGEDA